MKNNYSIAQRNAIVEDHLWCIDSIIQKNRPLMRAARLEYDDVYQQLAIRLIKAVAGYDPDKGNLQQIRASELQGSIPLVRHDRSTQRFPKERYYLAGHCLREQRAA